MRKPWTKERFDNAVATLNKSRTLAEACKTIGVSTRQLWAVFTGAGLESPSRYLKAPAVVQVPVVDPVEQHQAERQAAERARREKDLVARLADAEKRARFIADLRDAKPPVVKRRELRSGTREACGVALLSDAHIEEKVTLAGAVGRNEYNLQISEARMMRFFSALRWQLDFHRERWAVRDLILWLGGDLMTGHIHDELIETNEAHPTEAVLILLARLRSGIAQLLEDPNLESLTIPCNVGNHGRTTAKRRVKTVTENSWEWLMYNVLAGHFENEPRVRFEIPRAAHSYVTALDFKLHFHHGDEIKFQGGIGGVSVPLNKRVFKWDTVIDCDYHHIGHFHQLCDFGNVIVNGSVIGYNEYAMSIGAEYEPPQQAFYLLDSKRGKTSFSPLWVGEERGES